MKHHPAWAAFCIWFRGHLAFFLAMLFTTGLFAVYVSGIAFILSLPALLLYMPLCFLAGRIQPFALRFTVVMAIALLITHLSFVLSGSAGEDFFPAAGSWMHYAGLGSTFLSVVSAGYMLQDTPEERSFIIPANEEAGEA